MVLELKSTRRWFQYSLRSFLILLTALAVWLGIVVNRAREQREAVKAIKALGGGIWYDFELGYSRVVRDDEPIQYWWFGRLNREPPGPAWLRRLIGSEFFREVCVVDFQAISTDSEIRRATPYLARLHGLQLVDINAKVSVETLDEMRAALPECKVRSN